MKKVDFIIDTERWLVENDVIDSRFQITPSQAKDRNINQYINQVKWMLQDKAPDLFDEFKHRIKESHLRGMER